MSGDSPTIQLQHHFLIAMPGLEDPVFGKSLVYVCDHGSHGALGLIVNKPADVDLKALFDKLDMPLQREDLMQSPVYVGGPVQTERGFVLHPTMHAASMTPDELDHGPTYGATMRVTPEVEMTTSRDVLESLAEGKGPAQVLVCLGYSAWGAGQLESELGENAWLTVPADPRILFDVAPAARYNAALKLLGLEPWMLSSQSGRA